MSIESVLAEYLRSAAGRKKVQLALLESGKKGTPIKAAAIDESYKLLVNDLIHCIQDYLPLSLKNSELSLDSAYDISDPIIQKDGSIRVDISFNPAAVFRPSLDPNPAWGDGVENIVLHLSNGWNARGAVSGIWHGEITQSRRSYDGDDFMERAIFDFNTTHAGVMAVLGKQYR